MSVTEVTRAERYASDLPEHEFVVPALLAYKLEEQRDELLVALKAMMSMDYIQHWAHAKELVERIESEKGGEEP